MTYAQAKLYPSLRSMFVLAITSLLTVACAAERERAGSEPTEPQQYPTVSDIAGNYSATRLTVARDGSHKNLIGEPDTRLDIQLNLDGSVHGQLKIGTDPQLRSKQMLVGRWRLRIPNGVSFDLEGQCFLEDIYFYILSKDRLQGDWLGEGVLVTVELQRVN